MATEEKALEAVVLTRLLRLNATLQGFVIGIIAGLGIFVATNWLLMKAGEGEAVGPHLSLLGQFFIGYKVSFLGSLIGFAYAFGAGFLVGYCGASLYNWIVDMRETRRVASSAKDDRPLKRS